MIVSKNVSYKIGIVVHASNLYSWEAGMGGFLSFRPAKTEREKGVLCTADYLGDI